MRILSKKDICIFDTEILLMREMQMAKKKWLTRVKLSHKEKGSVASADLLEKKYLEAFKKWQRFLDKNIRIISLDKI